MADRRHPLGAFLKELRSKLGWSLRDVQARTGGRIHNAYLSQIESGKVATPAVETLVLLAEVYGVDVWTMLHRAGWVPERPPGTEDALPVDHRRPAFPAAILDDLTAEELDELVAYAGFLKSRRPSRSLRVEPPKR